MNIPDNYDIWEAHDREMERRLARRPVCVRCDKRIQDETAFLIEGEWKCEKCMDNFRVLVEDYIE